MRANKIHIEWLTRLRPFIYRHQSNQSVETIIKSGIGGIIAIGFVSLAGYVTGNALLMAPFGATCVLLFSVPQSPLSQPMNVVGGHLVSTVVGLSLHMIFPEQWWALGMAVGLAIALMAVLRITHPPAGADPLVVFFTEPTWNYILFPVAIGSIVLVIIAYLFHKITLKTHYPIQVPTSTAEK